MNRSPTAPLAVAAAILCTVAARGAVAMGARLEPVDMPCASGGKRALIAPGKVNVLVFFRPGHERSTTALAKLAHLQKSLGQRPIGWAAIASDRFLAEEIAESVREAGFSGPALVDGADELYGRLEVRLHPMVVILDRNRTVVSYQPFAQIDFEPIVRAKVLHALGEIDEAQLQKALAPPPALQGGEVNVARRYLKLGERLLATGDLPRALDAAQKSLEHDPKLAEAHALLGTILASQGHCPEALRAFGAALAIDPRLPGALEGKKRCAPR